MSPAGADVVVVGAGVVGLSIAWRAASKGLATIVVDPAPGRGATWAAAGMLAPVTEAHYGEEALCLLNLESARSWPGFAAELEQASGSAVGYRPCGTLAVAADGSDRAVLAELHRFQVGLGLASEMVSSRDCRALEPGLAPGIRGGLMAQGDHQVDNRALVAALLVAVERAGASLVVDRAAALTVEADRATGVDLGDGRRLGAGTVVLAAGCWSAHLAGLPPAAVPPVRPVKGQILRLAGPAPGGGPAGGARPGGGPAGGARPGGGPAGGAPLAVLSGNVRGLVGGRQVYLVPRADGTVVVGATVEEMGFDTTVSAQAVSDLLGDALALVPALGEMGLAEANAGLRPGSPDNAPIVGRSALPGLVLATGHYRNGILLAPLTSEAVVGLLAGDAASDRLAPFSPLRWDCPQPGTSPPHLVAPAPGGPEDQWCPSASSGWR